MAPFATAAELSLHLQRPVNEDAALLALEGASGAIRAWCGWSISQEETTFTVEGSGLVPLSLPTLLLTEVAEVVVDGETLAEGTGYEDYQFSRSGQLFRSAGWPARVKVTVECTHGHDPVPHVIRLLCLGVAARELNNPERLRSAAVGTVNRHYAHEMTLLEAQLLSGFMLPGRP